MVLLPDPNGEMDWLTFDWDDELKDYVTAITEPVDCIILGRKLAEGFIPHWATVAATPDNPECQTVRNLPTTHKDVFSTLLVVALGPHRFSGRYIVDEVAKLRANGRRYNRLPVVLPCFLSNKHGLIDGDSSLHHPGCTGIRHGHL
jgi:hypothetical protein